ncbi:hypothetical protein YTPLAS18_37520 [Nitrospira sp.]|nr:hypothetical protein YTPLAS18_37520 [Nitrospira sp.]
MPLSPLIRLGTSTWTYAGWQGQVYTRAYPKSKFSQLCLEEYAQYTYQGDTLFHCVGNDSTFYRPPTVNQLRRYAAQVPEDFEMCCKVWEEITIPAFARHERYGSKAGHPNPRFLDAELFKNFVLAPYRDAQFERHSGPFIFEFQRHSIPAEQFLSRLHDFFAQLPSDFRYAVEIRNSGLLGPRYHDILATHGVAHVYNHWSYMPRLVEQHVRMGGFTAPFTVLRLLTPLDLSYEAAKKRAEPYTAIVGELPEMRADTAALVRQAIGENRKAYVLVNNRAEGNAPLTVQGLVALLRT